MSLSLEQAQFTIRNLLSRHAATIPGNIGPESDPQYDEMLAQARLRALHDQASAAGNAHAQAMEAERRRIEEQRLQEQRLQEGNPAARGDSIVPGSLPPGVRLSTMYPGAYDVYNALTRAWEPFQGTHDELMAHITALQSAANGGNPAGRNAPLNTTPSLNMTPGTGVGGTADPRMGWTGTPTMGTATGGGGSAYVPGVAPGTVPGATDPRWTGTPQLAIATGGGGTSSQFFTNTTMRTPPLGIAPGATPGAADPSAGWVGTPRLGTSTGGGGSAYVPGVAPGAIPGTADPRAGWTGTPTLGTSTGEGNGSMSPVSIPTNRPAAGNYSSLLLGSGVNPNWESILNTRAAGDPHPMWTPYG